MGNVTELQCGELTTADATCLSFELSVAQAARAMRDHGDDTVIVVDRAGRAVGVLTARDLVVRIVAEERDPATTSIGQICADPIATLRADDNASYAHELMSRGSLPALPVTDDSGRPLGLVEASQVQGALILEGKHQDRRLRRRVRDTVSVGRRHDI